MALTPQQQRQQDANVATWRAFDKSDTPPSLHKPAQVSKKPERTMRIPLDAYQQAVSMAERYPKTYNKKGKPSWQAVIRRAIYQGLPNIEAPQERLTRAKQDKNTVEIVGGKLCPVHQIPASCSEDKDCEQCDAYKSWQAEK